MCGEGWEGVCVHHLIIIIIIIIFFFRRSLWPWLPGPIDRSQSCAMKKWRMVGKQLFKNKVNNRQILLIKKSHLTGEWLDRWQNIDHSFFANDRSSRFKQSARADRAHSPARFNQSADKTQRSIHLTIHYFISSLQANSILSEM